eukprot:scaffold22607_cov123-Cylindrotheca_fusiformis.AAC.6
MALKLVLFALLVARMLGGWAIAVGETDDGPPTMLQLEMKPTSARILEHHHQRQLKSHELPQEWFHPYSNAVYSTFHGFNSTSNTYDEDFQKFRHLSRHERNLRHSLGLDLQPYWYGNYSNYSTVFFPHHRELQQFNSYQSAPLSQGFGTHYVHLWIGTPTPQRQSVIVDTGSRFTAFPCDGCVNCGQEHHTDPYFQPTRSDSFVALQCPLQCLETASCQVGDADSYCRFSQAYTEGSSWKAYQAMDLLYCGGTDILQAASHVDTNFSIPFMFGCLQQESGLFVTQLADGIMGLSAHETTLPKQLYNHGKLEYNMFALCFRKELGSSKRGVTAGTMTLGGVSSALDTSPMVYAKNTKTIGWYTVQVNNLYIAKKGGRQFLFDSEDSPDLKDVIAIPIDRAAVNSGKGVIVDSGTTDTYLNAKALPAFTKIWKEVTGMEYKHSAVGLTQEQLQALPTVLVQLQAAPSSFDTNPDPVLGQVGYLDPSNPMDVLLAIPATSYMEYFPTMKTYSSRLYFTETAGGVLGANAMQGHNVLFDWHHHRIGFSQSSCAYDLIEKEEQDKHMNVTTDTFGDGCRLGRPILSVPCMHSVDVSICQASDNPTNVGIMGTEVWTRLVLNPGLEEGKCHTFMENWSLTQNIQLEPSQINCTLDGLCQEYRPCQVPCMEAIKFYSNETETKAEVQSEDPREDGNKDCGEIGVWSACDYNCQQTMMISRLDKSGACVEASRIKRDCHVNACGRSDSCLVPYLVHTILVLEGAAIEKWDPVATEDFRKQFTKVAHLDEFELQHTNPIFQEGDVNILAIRPWFDGINDETLFVDESNDASRQDPEGIELVLQVSIFNAKAQRSHRRWLRDLLQEVGIPTSNNTSPIRPNGGTESSCEATEMYPLAKQAVDLSSRILKTERFEFLLADTMPAVRAVRVLSSWTINTQMYDEEINYFGPLGSRWGPYVVGFRIFCEVLYKACSLWVLLSFAMYAREKYRTSCFAPNFRAIWQSTVIRLCKWWTGRKWPRYHQVYTHEQDDSSHASIHECEMTVTEYKKGRITTTPKRRNLGLDA